jgi:hypothetical protein
MLEPKLQHHTISKNRECLLDLISGAQDESTGGKKKDTHVVVDSYSRFDEINLSRDIYQRIQRRNIDVKI